MMGYAQYVHTLRVTRRAELLKALDKAKLVEGVAVVTSEAIDKLDLSIYANYTRVLGSLALHMPPSKVEV